MTGSPLQLRRYSNCNLHARSPLLPGDRHRHLHDPPPRYNRYKLYIPEEQYRAGSSRTQRDRHGPYIWMGTDCLWEWLETRPGIAETRLSTPFRRLHDHVHTPHRKDRFDAALAVQRLLVRATRSRELDERLDTRVYPLAHRYRVSVRFAEKLSPEQTNRLRWNLPGVKITDLIFRYDNTSRTDVVWTARASSPTHARERAQEHLAALGIERGGTFWETPTRIHDTQETPA